MFWKNKKIFRMNIYFLLEGRHTEKKNYCDWLKYLLPEFTKVQYYDEVEENNYYLISGNGYPQTITEGLPNAVQKIQEIGKYDYLVIVIDADEDTVDERKQYIYNFIDKKEIDIGITELVLIIQNRCIETWLLGNRERFKNLSSVESPLSDYLEYYDLVTHDPELMGAYNGRNHADFHFAYLKAILATHGIKYSKKFPRITNEESYLKELIKRVEDETEHLKTFQTLINFCHIITNHQIP